MLSKTLVNGFPVRTEEDVFKDNPPPPALYLMRSRLRDPDHGRNASVPTPSNFESFGYRYLYNLQEIRAERGITLYRLAKILGNDPTRSHLGNIEKLRSRCHPDAQHRIAEVLDCSVEDLVGEQESPEIGLCHATYSV